MNNSRIGFEVIKKILEKYGPLLGSELNQKLRETMDISSAYARKIIQRATDNEVIFSTKPVSFGRGQYLYYLQHHNISDALQTALQKQRKGLHRIFQSLVHNKGRILTSEAIKISAAVTNRNFFPANEPKEKVLDNLLQLGIIKDISNYNEISYIIAKMQNISSEAELYPWYRRHMVNRLFALEAATWLERCNITAWNQTHIFDSEQNRVDFNGHLWDAVGFTYLYGFYESYYENEEKKKTPSFVFMEMLFHRQTYLEDVEGFVARIEMQSARMKNYKTGTRIIPILFYRTIEREAFEIAKEKGILLYSMRDWIGEFSVELFEYLVNPYYMDNDFSKKLETYLKSLQLLGGQYYNIYRELFIIKHSKAYLERGWNIRRHIHYRVGEDKFYADWLMFDHADTPVLCTFISKFLSKKEKEMLSFLENTFSKYQSIYSDVKGDFIKPKWMIFDEDGLYLQSPNS
ncbi:hypothetical protein [Anoxybacillus flavithermus]|uniref:hypothetical protein n=1 Tax=Anoxybacillus flavithermus TaxID=33934 RepID=UPI0018684857|nr:hypothetical protein [Anoxybacillus flavithermus]MBE2914117.1 hypothetical protein [Anoxybacillus flavithermus]